ncbi:unnamed protein product [Effrenium voratum]|uniref:Uncharacterized protein n=1 Tax=Effrenium voratum TaxID=2562239 RepID=A0AA36N2B4_9DINO|nr:unnamed protein product [Effrenium voratum]
MCTPSTDHGPCAGCRPSCLLRKREEKQEQAANTSEEDDVWHLPRQLSAARVGPQAVDLWREECTLAAARRRKPRLLRTLIRLSWVSSGLFLGVSLCCVGAYVLAPLCLRGMLHELKQTTASAQSLLPWGLGFSLSFVLISIFVGISKAQGTVAAVKMRAALQMLVFEHSQRLAVDQLGQKHNPSNLMTVDAERPHMVFAILMPHSFVLVLVLPVLLITQVGVVPAAACLLSCVGTLICSVLVGGHTVTLRRAALQESDRRLHLVEQYLDGIRVLKMNGWAEAAEERLRSVRAQELRLQRKAMMWKLVNSMLGLVAPCMVGFCMFTTYAVLGGEMTVEVVFPAMVVLRVLQIMMSLLPISFSAIAEFNTASARLRSFLAIDAWGEVEELKGPAVETVGAAEKGAAPGSVLLEEASFQRGQEGRCFRLGPLSLSLAPGELCVVCGPVGSGKSSLVMGMLGELGAPVSGRAEVCGGMALAGQEPWILSASLKKNILSFRDCEEGCYKQALHRAQLQADLAALPAGDETEIGSKGINISGGQKARVGLARALLTSKDVVFLDDVLSAVDVHVARGILRALLELKETTRIVVANTFLPLLLPHAHKVVVLGETPVVASAAEAVATSPWLREAVGTMASTELEESNPKEQPGQAPAQAEAPADVQKPQVDGSLLIAEDRNVGVLSFNAYASYFKHASTSGSWCVGALLFLVVVLLALLAESFRTLTEIWVTVWTDQEDTQSLGFWIAGFGAVTAMLCVVGLVRAAVYVRLIERIGGGSFTYMCCKVLNASVPLFFDVVPTGRILNRFSKDLEVMDTQLPEVMNEFFTCVAFVISSIVMCTLVSVYALLGLVPLCLVFAYIRRYYTASFRELQRMESISRTPLYVLFQEVLTGLVHIRAYGLQSRIREDFLAKLDANNRMFFHLHSLVPFLVFRVNFIAAAFITVMTGLVIFFGRQLDAALTGLALSASAGLIGRLHQTVKTSADVESSFTSVERLQHFHGIEQEKQAEAEAEAGADWPFVGKLVFEEVQLRYRPHLPLVLRQISFNVLGGQRVGLIGRTGSGKSTMMLALLRLVELSGGRILLDGKDLAQVPLKLLRGHAVAIIPQDPFLFAGTLQENLDPFGRYSEREQLEALRLAGLDVEEGLSAPVRSRGSNFSVGQRQLLCFARAMLRKSRVVLLDEATANIDALTDEKLQQTLRTCFQGSTLLVIAHRLSTVADSDLLVCLDHGSAVEVGSPQELRSANGLVAKMFTDAGEPAAEPADTMLSV